jgi:hypothetical protein
MTRTVLSLGGMSGVGKSTAARRMAQRYDLWLYAIDARTWAHAEAMRVRALELTMDELWLDRSPEQMAADFLAEARDRFSLIDAEVQAIPDDGAPVLVEGPQLVPGVVPEPALFVIAAPARQQELLRGRGSFTYAATSDPDRAFANRVRRDELLADGLRPYAVAIEEVAGTERVLETFVREHASDWVERTDHGDVAARRRAENDRRLDQWRRYAAREPKARALALDFVCECGRSGCERLVEVAFDRTSERPFAEH